MCIRIYMHIWLVVVHYAVTMYGLTWDCGHCLYNEQKIDSKEKHYHHLLAHLCNFILNERHNWQNQRGRKVQLWRGSDCITARLDTYSECCSPAARASSLLSSSWLGCLMFQEVRGSVSMSCRLLSSSMSMWLLLLSYLGMKQLLPLLNASLMISSVWTSSCMLRNTAIRLQDTYLGWLNNWEDKISRGRKIMRTLYLNKSMDTCVEKQTLWKKPPFKTFTHCTPHAVQKDPLQATPSMNK